MTIEETVLTILEGRRGRDWAISRESLRKSVEYELKQQVKDRAIRKAVETLRSEGGRGSLICSSSRTRGYYIAESYEDVLEVYREERRRAMTLLVRLRKQRDAARRHFGGQLELRA